MLMAAAVELGKAVQDYLLSRVTLTADVLVQGNFRNAVTNPIAEQMGIPIMQNWNQTVPIWQLHHHYHARWAHAGYSNGDCKFLGTPLCYSCFQFCGLPF